MLLELHQTIQTPLDSHNCRLGLEQFVVDVEREIMRLRQTILEANTSINKCTSISTLPPELITEIFILACHPEYDATREGLGKHWEMWPLRLGAVCKGWRDLAWSSSRLWSSIVFVSRSRSISDFEDVLDSWISRSGNHPLLIHIDAPCLASPCVESMIGSLISTAPRWKNVSLHLSEEIFHHFVKCDCFPILEQLCFKNPDQDRARPREWNIGKSLDIFRSSNMLQIKHLHVPKYIKCFHIWPSALSSLTTFSVGYIYGDQAYHILRCTSSSLQGFVAEQFVSDEYSDREEHRTLILPILRSLVLKDAIANYNTGLNQLLSKISTPSIKELTIEFYDCDPTPIPSMPDFMSNLSRSLRRLHITCCLEDCTFTIGCILKVESLLELYFTGGQQSCKALVDSLGPVAPKESSGEHLPLLETFTMTVDMCFLPVEGLQEMLAYRCSGVSTTCVRLKTARIETCKCCQDGINVLRRALADSKSDITFATPVDYYCLSHFFHPVCSETNLSSR